MPPRHEQRAQHAAHIVPDTRAADGGFGQALRGTGHEARDEILYEAELLEKSQALLDQCAVHIPQLDGGTLLIIPPTYLKEWARMDDDLDCAFAEDEPVESRLTYTRANPFAFDHLWMDSNTGRALTGPAGDAVALRGTERGGQAAVRVRFHGEDKPAYADPEDAAKRIVPGVPREVVHLVRHLGSFLAPGQLLRLRPARTVWMG